MITIAVSNQKGGVGKTTTAVTLSALWAQSGIKTLLLDLDPQGNVADSLGMEAGKELTMLLMPGINTWNVAPARENLDVMRLDKSGAALKTALAGETLRELALKNMLDRDMEYDLVVMDCAPSVDILHICALCAADWLLVPTRLEQLAVKGVKDVLTSLANLRQRGISRAKWIGVLPTFYDRTTTETLDQFEHLVKAFGENVLPPIPVDTAMREAVREGKTIMEYAPRARSLVGLMSKGKGTYLGGYKMAQSRVEEVIWR